MMALCCRVCGVSRLRPIAYFCLSLLSPFLISLEEDLEFSTLRLVQQENLHVISRRPLILMSRDSYAFHK